MADAAEVEFLRGLVTKLMDGGSDGAWRAKHEELQARFIEDNRLSSAFCEKVELFMEALWREPMLWGSVNPLVRQYLPMFEERYKEATVKRGLGT